MKTYYQDQVEKVGECWVDSGTVMVGDPCYVLPEESTGDPGLDYEDLLNKWKESDYKDNPVRIEGVTVFMTPWGDGVYPIYAVKKDSKIVRIIIDFEDEEDYDY